MRSSDRSAAPQQPRLKPARVIFIALVLVLVLASALANDLFGDRGILHGRGHGSGSALQARHAHGSRTAARARVTARHESAAHRGHIHHPSVAARFVGNCRIRYRHHAATPVATQPQQTSKAPANAPVPSNVRRGSKARTVRVAKASSAQRASSPRPSEIATAAQPSAGQRAYLSFNVNGVDEGEVLAIVRPGDVLVPLAALKRAGIINLNAEPVTIDGVPYVSLRHLAPAVSYTFNERSLALNVMAQPSYLGSAVIDLQGSRAPALVYSKNASAFFNYAVNWENFNQLSEFSEVGVSSNGNLYYSGFSFAPGGKLIRGLTNATFDNPSSMKRWVVGDTFASGGLFGGNAFIGGISVSRDFGLNPYFIQYPGIGISGQALTPSTAQVYVNGHLVSTQPVAPGKFDITNIPVVAGGGNAQVVVTDAFGRTQTLSSTYYYSTTVLARGLSEYSYNLGAKRENVDISSGDYGPVVFIGQDRVGITDWFTGGAMLNGGAGVISGGPTASFRLGRGQLGLNASLSHAAGVGGSAAEADYSYQNKFISYGGTLAAVSSNFANASLAPTDNRTTRLASVFTGFQIGPRANLTMSYTASRLRDTGDQDVAALTGSVLLSRRFDLVATADSTYGAASANAHQYFVSLNYQLGSNTLGAVSQQGGSAGGGSGISVQQSLPLGEGVGYLFSHGSGSEIQDDDYFQVQTSYGFYQASYLQENGSSQKSLLASGGLVDAGDGIMFTRAVEDGFAVIDVPGVRGVRGYYNNQLIGRTDGRGRLLIPNLLSYYQNKVEISDQDVPLDYSIGATEEVAAPPYRGGALVRFPVQRVAAVTGKVVVDDRGQKVPSFGELRLTLHGHEVVSELTDRGEFYLENLSPGLYAGEVEYADGACAFELVVPNKRQAVTEVGSVPCAPRQIGQLSP